MYSHYPTNWWEMYREGENRPPIGGVLVYKNMVKINDAISHKLSGQFVKFTARFETILIYSTIWNDIDLQHDLKRY